MQINTLIPIRHFHVVTIILVFVLFIWFDSSTGEESSVSRLSTEKAQHLFKDIMTNCVLPSSGLGDSWEIPADNLDAKGVSINKNKAVILAKVKQNFTVLYRKVFELEGIPEFFQKEIYYPIYILATTTDLTIVDSKLFITTDQNRWVPYNSLKKGCYVMYFCFGGIYLESKQADTLIQFKNPYTGENRNQLEKNLKAGIPVLTDFKILPGEKSGISIGFFNGNDVDLLFK